MLWTSYSCYGELLWSNAPNLKWGVLLLAISTKTLPVRFAVFVVLLFYSTAAKSEVYHIRVCEEIVSALIVAIPDHFRREFHFESLLLCWRKRRGGGEEEGEWKRRRGRRGEKEEEERRGRKSLGGAQPQATSVMQLCAPL